MELVKDELNGTVATEINEILYPDFGGNLVNVVKQNSKFSDNVFTVNAARLMDNHKEHGNPIYPISDYVDFMNHELPYNITKYQPAVGKVILLGITRVSPLILASIIKTKDADLSKYSEPYEYFVIGVHNKAFNDNFGKKAIFTLKQTAINQYNGIALANSEDPLSGFNLAKTFSDLKSDLMKRKDEASIERVYCRTILLVDDMEIDGYTF